MVTGMTQQGSAAAERPRSFLACIIYFSNTMRGSWSVWCVHIQEEKTTFQVTTATPMTQQNWNPRHSCLLFNPTTFGLKAKACVEKPQVPLSGDSLYDPVLLLACWLAFLFINKSPFTVSTLCMDCSNHLLLDLGFLFVWLWVCSRNSHFLWYVLYVNSAPRHFASVSSCLAYNVPL